MVLLDVCKHEKWSICGARKVARWRWAMRGSEIGVYVED